MAALLAPVLAASTVLFVGGQATPDEPLTAGQLSTIVAPIYGNPTRTVEWKQNHPQPQGINEVVASLLVDSGNPTTFSGAATLGAPNRSLGLIGLSSGADSVRRIQRILEPAALAAAVPDQAVTFSYVADPHSPTGLRARFGVADTVTGSRFTTTYIHGEYDPWADFPDRPLNLVATANSVLALPYVHLPTGTGSADDPLTRLGEAEKDQIDDTTSVLRAPTKQLPLTRPMRDTLKALAPDAASKDDVDRLVNEVDKPLRAVVDAGYSRNDKTGGLVKGVRDLVAKVLRPKPTAATPQDHDPA
ncbi:PE-PPE domain-containing protein [Mycolicibacterium brumae]|uniref:PE-PPE domain-containing protein n=1 Tax=Mycolicibacterium brumae TaxID=85968 RepID=A0A2G5P666_9MYCO|nr:PE-PPE domain-containing protein [Mycolicibacterium brumae]MCV7192999.1 PE-PPE domain-containing protein [Mycolicibacterium brumae]PIB73859.1 PE-PPE domain-containing protein [Mycolicibacterium brumae]RWA23589.1 hypothetical protein MBRU_01815 [Mycolicibacterium brumae DSM 44177]UWW08482.1 PE-PPE domain-containing protein [Mycolicibacterium brumae]